MSVDPKKKAVLERIKHLEQHIIRAHEYLENDKHANWEGFQPLFAKKLKDGKELPPHKDWVRKQLLPRMERSLAQNCELLERLESPVTKKYRQLREKYSPPG